MRRDLIEIVHANPNIIEDEWNTVYIINTVSISVILYKRELLLQCWQYGAELFEIMYSVLNLLVMVNCISTSNLYLKNIHRERCYLIRIFR